MHPCLTESNNTRFNRSMNNQIKRQSHFYKNTATLLTLKKHHVPAWHQLHVFGKSGINSLT